MEQKISGAEVRHEGSLQHDRRRGDAANADRREARDYENTKSATMSQLTRMNRAVAALGMSIGLDEAINP